MCGPKNNSKQVNYFFLGASAALDFLVPRNWNDMTIELGNTKEKIPFWHGSYAPSEAYAILLEVLFEDRTVHRGVTSE